MNRLIDDANILKDIKDWQRDIHDNEPDAEKYDFVFERIYEMLEEQPTAYDTNKVVSELEKKSVLARPIGWSKSYEIVTLKDAIDSVRGGEIS